MFSIFCGTAAPAVGSTIIITFYLTRIIPEKFPDALFPPKRSLPPHPDSIAERGKSKIDFRICLRKSAGW
jgi:hypothetical protein